MTGVMYSDGVKFISKLLPYVMHKILLMTNNQKLNKESDT
jgi:hypothetical protein